jgi:hypothetical protein
MLDRMAAGELIEQRPAKASLAEPRARPARHRGSRRGWVVRRPRRIGRPKSRLRTTQLAPGSSLLPLDGRRGSLGLQAPTEPSGEAIAGGGTTRAGVADSPMEATYTLPRHSRRRPRRGRVARGSCQRAARRDEHRHRHAAVAGHVSGKDSGESAFDHGCECSRHDRSRGNYSPGGAQRRLGAQPSTGWARSARLAALGVRRAFE